jgi:hypothetical protein
MFFLLRMAFWLTIVLALLPAGNKQPSAQGPEIGAAFSAAGSAMSDARHFCERQPDACEVGSQLATMIGQRAQAGAKMVYELIAEHAGPSETGSVDKHEPAAKDLMPLPPERPARLNASERH